MCTTVRLEPEEHSPNTLLVHIPFPWVILSMAIHGRSYVDRHWRYDSFLDYVFIAFSKIIDPRIKFPLHSHQSTISLENAASAVLRLRIRKISAIMADKNQRAPCKGWVTFYSVSTGFPPCKRLCRDAPWIKRHSTEGVHSDGFNFHTCSLQREVWCSWD